jgi:thiol-disulfide isomerase/thioredoxin
MLNAIQVSYYLKQLTVPIDSEKRRRVKNENILLAPILTKNLRKTCMANIFKPIQTTAQGKKVFAFVAVTLLAIGAGIFTYQSQRSDFETVSGQGYQWSELQGQWTVINYFAPWCAPCLREMPELNAFSQNLPEDTLLFAINYDRQTSTQITEMANKYTIEVPIIFASENTVLPMEKPPYLPATFIVGPEGKVVDTIMGEVSEQELRERIQQLKTAANKAA